MSSCDSLRCSGCFIGTGLEGVTPISRRGSRGACCTLTEGGGGEGDTRCVGGGARTGTWELLVVGGATRLGGVVILTAPIQITK